MQNCQVAATAVAGLKLARALDIRAAIEVKEHLDWAKDREYLLQIVKKNEGDGGTSTGRLDTLYRVLTAFAAARSIRAADLELIGLHYNPWSSTFAPQKKRSTWYSWLGWLLLTLSIEPLLHAQIDGHLNAISARISGTVVYINPKVENNQYVEAGTLLVELDPSDYQAALDHARADLATREAEARSAGVNVPITQTSAFSRLRLAEAARDEAAASVDAEQANLLAAQYKVRQDEAVYERAERDRVRYQALVEKREISRSEYDARETEAIAAAQALESDRAGVTSIREKIAAARNLVAQRQAQVQEARTAPQQVVDAQAKSQSSVGEVDRARADVRTAELNLGYTKIYAPVSGVIGRKTVELGHRIQPGQTLLAIVPLDDTWVTADFKETQLKYMRPRLGSPLPSTWIHLIAITKGRSKISPAPPERCLAYCHRKMPAATLSKLYNGYLCGFASIVTRTLSTSCGQACRLSPVQSALRAPLLAILATRCWRRPIRDRTLISIPPRRLLTSLNLFAAADV